MYTLKVADKNKYYDIHISKCFDDFFNIFQKYIKLDSKIFIVTDSMVNSIYKNLITDFAARFNTCVFVFEEGEKNKNYATISQIYNFFINNNADRESIVIAIGGGVVGDLAGFAAATFMRGLRFINIPTTLISQVDSSVGGKVGYNFNNLKNAVGCFYNPEFVYISTHFLKTLNDEQRIDGMGEIIKYGLIKDKALLDFIKANYKDIKGLEEESFLFIIKECLAIKAKIVAEDYRDEGLRNILNFGHTIGHGIEISSNYSVSHGAAVALGILCALKLSEKVFNLPENIYQYILDVYKKLSLPIGYKVDNYSSFLYAIKHDKKNTDNINFVLLEDMNKCRIKIPIKEDEILWAVENSIDNAHNI